METLDHFFVVASQVGTLFLLTAVGYVLARLGKFSRDTQSQLTTLLLYVVTPCLIVDILQISPSRELIQSMGQCLLLTLALYLGFALLMQLFFAGRRAMSARCSASARPTATWASWGSR